jgi:LacI family transcriptional regulator
VRASGATAVLAFNDLVAMGLLSALHEAGVSVPEDLSVTGFDDIPFARYTTPPLTTASVPVTELGEQAWARLWALLNEEPPDHNIYFRPRVEVRGSTGPVPR